METHTFAGSTALVRGAYEPTTGLLRLWFTSDPHQAYDFPQVPAHLWQGLCRAKSAGSYYNQHIREQYDDPSRPVPRWQH